MTITEAVALEIAERRAKHPDAPDRELSEHLLVAVQRERVAAVGYDTARLGERLRKADLPDEARTLIARAITQIWLDETLHARYVLGVLLRQRELLVTLGARKEDVEGGIGGWMTAVVQHTSWKDAPAERLGALVVEAGGKLTGRIPDEVRDALTLAPLRDWCLFSADAEKSAIISFDHMIELARRVKADPEAHPFVELPPGFVEELQRMARDERVHRDVFELLAAHLGDDDALLPHCSVETLRAGLDRIEGWQSAPTSRDGASAKSDAPHPICSGGLVVVARGAWAEEKIATFQRALETSGFFEAADAHRGPIAIKLDLMLAHHHDDKSSYVDPELVEHLVAELEKRGHRDITLCDAQNLYSDHYENRSIEAIARYVGLSPERYRFVDLATEQEPHSFTQAMGVYAMGRTWRDAAFRVSFAKLKTHPTAVGQLTLRNTGTAVPQNGEYFFDDRLSDFSRIAAAVVYDFPPHFGLVDGYAHAADGLMGVIADPTPKHPKVILAGADCASVDYVGLWLMGERDPARAPDLRAVIELFGDPRERGSVLGDLTPLADWDRADAGLIGASLTAFASPVYASFSQRGALFMAVMDPIAFPPKGETLALSMARKALRVLLGIDG